MSEATICNHCSLREVKRRAKEEGKVVSLLGAKSGGTDYHVHKPEEPATESNRRGWFMELTDHCVC